MSLSKQKLVQISQAIREQLQKLNVYRYGELQKTFQMLMENLDQLQTIQRKLGICTAHNWTAAGGKLINNLAGILRDFPSAVATVEWAIGPCQIKAPCLRDVLAELQQTQQELGRLRYDSEHQILAVTTEAIKLEGLYFGEFEIQLHIPSLAEMRYNSLYSIVALDPHPAGSNQCVTHPHVSDEKLCAGDAAAAIQQALANGRICDFFQLVHSVLTTYNPASPFVKLEEWDGIPCYDCGYTMSSDDSYFCQGCENTYCEECISSCRHCEDFYCFSCLADCRVCGDSVCGACVKDCPDCGEGLCHSCVEDNQCPCVEETEDENESEENATINEKEQVRQPAESGTEAA